MDYSKKRPSSSRRWPVTSKPSRLRAFDELRRDFFDEMWIVIQRQVADFAGLLTRKLGMRSLSLYERRRNRGRCGPPTRRPRVLPVLCRRSRG